MDERNKERIHRKEEDGKSTIHPKISKEFDILRLRISAHGFHSRVDATETLLS